VRKRTLAGVCVVLALAILIALKFLGVSVGIGLAPFVIYLVLVPLLMVPMTLLNQRLLTWRKARGRDIAQEEEYEIGETGIISLRPKPDSPAW
jgi:hypothetical protein